MLGVSLRVGGRMALDGVSLQVRGGELVVVEGARAAGKSLLARVAAAQRGPDGGELWIAGRDVTALQRSSLPYVRRNVGFFSGDVPLLPRMTALENVMLAVAARGFGPRPARDLALRALGRVGAASAATRRTDVMSASEARLVALARALAGAPPLLVIDEPSAGMAASDAGGVLSAILGAVEAGGAALCTTADAAFASAAVRAGGRRVRLEGGRLLPGGGPVGVIHTRRSASEGITARVEATK
jgi:ABC-type ATPase involved in cell division